MQMNKVLCSDAESWECFHSGGMIPCDCMESCPLWNDSSDDSSDESEDSEE